MSSLMVLKLGTILTQGELSFRSMSSLMVLKSTAFAKF